MSENHSPDTILQNALEISDADERAAYLDEACGEDRALRHEVESLLAAHSAAADTFMGTLADRGWEETPTEKEGDHIGRYKLLQEIGEGGGGTVYMADQIEPVKRRVALKVIKLGMDTRQVVARFEAERQALALMDHPNIAKVLDAGATESGRPYFVMELVRGVPITKFCDENKLSTKERLVLFIQVCEAVQHAHQKGIIHRDLKPGNILVTMMEDRPLPKVIDFGIAKATQQELTEKTLFTQHGHIIGTPAYMSPEQASLTGYDIDTRSDIYALGVVLYELLCGNTPFDTTALLKAGYDEIRRVIAEDEPSKPSTRLSSLGEGELTTLATHRHTGPKRLSKLMRGDLDWVVMKALEKDRRRRYETANGFAMDVQRFLDQEPVTAGPPGMRYKMGKFVRRNKTFFAAAAAIAAALIIGTLVSLIFGIQANEEAIRATVAEKRERGAREDAEDINEFLISAFQSPDPAREGRTFTVAETLDTAAKGLATRFTNQPARRAKLQSTLAHTYQALGLHDEALALYEKARVIYRTTLGQEHPDSLDVMNSMVTSYRSAGRQDEALTMAEKLLSLNRQVRGPKDAGTLVAMSNLANCYHDADRQEEALQMREGTLGLFRKEFGAKHPGTLNAMANLADSLHDADRQDEAFKMHSEVLALSRESLGARHPETIRAMNHLALSQRAAGRRDEALKLQEQVLTLRREVLGAEHADTLRVMSDLADHYPRRRRNAALVMREEVLALCHANHGDRHSKTLEAMHKLATSFREVGRLAEAIMLGEQVMELSREVLGAEHPNLLRAMSELARSSQEAKLMEQALNWAIELLPLSRKVNGDEHRDTLEAMSRLAHLYHITDHPDEALAMQEEVLLLSRKINGDEDRTTLGEMTTLALFHLSAQQLQDALQFQQDALQVARRTLPEGDAVILAAMQNLARIHSALGEKAEERNVREDIAALRAATSITLTFQQGADSGYGAYNSTDFIRIREQFPDLRHGSGFLGTSGPPVNGRTLLIFNAIFGHGPGRIPAGAHLKSATLRLNVTNGGPRPILHQLATVWDTESLTHNNATLSGNKLPGIQTDDAEAFAAPVTYPPNGNAGVTDIEVTATVQNWSNGDGNFGWLIRSGGGRNAWAAEGHERPLVSHRPQLIVVYDRNSIASPPIAAWQEAVKFDPALANTQYWLGKAHCDSERYGEALMPLQAARKLLPDGPHAREVREHLLKVLVALGRASEANRVRQEIAELEEPDGLTD